MTLQGKKLNTNWVIHSFLTVLDQGGGFKTHKIWLVFKKKKDKKTSLENLTTNFKPKCPCSYICICICIYIYVCIISFLLGFWVIFNNCIFFTHSLTLFQNKHLVLGIWYCQSIQNPRPNTCWFLIQNLVSHGILTYFQTNSVKIFIHCLFAC